MAGQHLSGPKLAISYLIVRSSRVEFTPCGMSPLPQFVAPTTDRLGASARRPLAIVLTAGPLFKAGARTLWPLINQAGETWFDGVNV